jgi:hypothetical protein
MHQPNLACNVDMEGGNSTFNSTGILAFKGGIPSEWVSKSLDICNFVSTVYNWLLILMPLIDDFPIPERTIDIDGCKIPCVQADS